MGKENDNNKVMVLILGVATILIALVGATFAYFTSTINKPNGDQSVTVSTATVEGVTYTASGTLALVDAMPGATANTTFTISNPNASAPVKYGLKFVPDLNDFDSTDGLGQLMITVSGGALLTEKVMDYTDGKSSTEQIIQDEISIDPKEEHQYTIKVDFVNTDFDQEKNQNKNFAGHVEVTQSLITTTTGN